MAGIMSEKDEQDEVCELHDVERGREHKLAREHKEDDQGVFCFNRTRSKDGNVLWRGTVRRSANERLSYQKQAVDTHAKTKQNRKHTEARTQMCKSLQTKQWK